MRSNYQVGNTLLLLFFYYSRKKNVFTLKACGIFFFCKCKKFLLSLAPPQEFDSATDYKSQTYYMYISEAVRHTPFPHKTQKYFLNKGGRWRVSAI